MANLHEPKEVPRERKLVVAALIRNSEGALLLSKRLPQKPMPGYWELPGGKMEQGESPEVALRREIAEELGVTADIRRIYDVIFYSYDQFDLLMMVYECKIEQKPRPLEVADIHWVFPKDFSKYQVLPADEPLLDRLRQEDLAR